MLKLNSKNQKIWFGSDFHFRHNPRWPVPLWEMRGFKSVEEQDKFLFNSINKLVKPNDILFFLGDFSLNSSVDDTKFIFRSIQCQNIYKIWGNHRSNTYKIYKEIRESFAGLGGSIIGEDLLEKQIYPLTWENVTFCGDSHMVHIDDTVCYLQHMAPLIWPFQSHGSYALCGHSHSTCLMSRPDSKEGKLLDCSFDTAKKYNGEALFSWDEIKHIMNNKEIKTYDHHKKEDYVEKR